ncbi:MAG: UDP-glucose 4-epimerase GalE [Acidimicrobiia bacterium]|nr:UDP-glucose 4-epimerase GalE [Acidimicrobiia bacterium]
MAILVTGGAGYIGSHSVRALTKAGRDVVVLDDLSRGDKSVVEDLLRVPLIVGGTGDKDIVSGIFSSHEIEAVMHFAAYAYVGESVERPDIYYRNNVTSTLSLLESMVEHGVRRFVFSSTCATYGEPSSIPIVETEPQEPINPYGASKLMVERILADFDTAYRLRSVSLRYFNAAGADPAGDLGEHHDPETHLIPLTIDAAHGRRDALQVFGDDYDTSDGTCVRDYIHVNDLADAHVLGLDYLEADGASAAFNLGNGQGFSVMEVIDSVARVTDHEVPHEVVGRRQGDPPSLVGSAAKARDELGWNPKYPDLDVIVEHAVNAR